MQCSKKQEGANIQQGLWSWTGTEQKATLVAFAREAGYPVWAYSKVSYLVEHEHLYELADDREHGEARVLDLGQLQPLLLRRALLVEQPRALRLVRIGPVQFQFSSLRFGSVQFGSGTNGLRGVCSLRGYWFRGPTHVLFYFFIVLSFFLTCTCSFLLESIVVHTSSSTYSVCMYVFSRMFVYLPSG